MQRIDEFVQRHSHDDFADADHQEHVERGPYEIVLIAGAALLLVGGFIASLV
jgi:hypothetical protein